MPLVQNELIGSAKALVRRRDAEAALALLHRIAAHVRPVMKRRSLRVGALEEFYPTNPGLLGINVNRGQTIRIRLRRPGDDTAFLEFDDLVGTMLHELTHNIHGPHDSAFYKYLDGLFDEYDRDRDAGFRPDGDRLGGAHAVQGTAAQKAAALAAGERRRATAAIMLPAGGRRLGAPSELERIMSPAQLAAMAAERRARDRVWCGGHGDEGGGADDAAPTPVGPPTVPDRPRGGAGSDRQLTPAAAAALARWERSGGPSRSSTAVSSAASRKRSPPTSPAAADKRPRQVVDLTSDETPVADADGPPWTCAACTLVNRPLALQCECCLSIRAA